MGPKGMKPRGKQQQPAPPAPATRRVRADAQRNLDGLLEAAKVVFAASGVDAPVREIASQAGVGVGTFYRHFPERSDLVAAVFRREVDACAAEAAALAAKHEPGEALVKWLERYTHFIATTRGGQPECPRSRSGGWPHPTYGRAAARWASLRRARSVPSSEAHAATSIR